MKNTGLMCFGIILIFFIFPQIAGAEFRLPYVVDEKPRVMFSDSAAIVTASTTYRGLENYTQNYVDGYAHITFTYTHHRCCFSDASPGVYITRGDPRIGQSLLRGGGVAFVIPSQNSDPTINTNWFLYDIKFDATGYFVSVKEAGQNEIFGTHIDFALEDTDWVMIANRHPNVGNDNSMAFTPVPVREQVDSSIINPVIIIPGIMGSARKNGELVIDPILHTYDDLIKTLDENYYTPGVDLFTFPYEWRDSNALTANLLEDKIEEVKQICNCSKVDLVAHSMGGLVARQYIQSAGYRNDVDQVIFLGTPHKGSPKAYLQWEAGEFPPELNEQLTKTFFSAEALRNGHLRLFDYIRNRPILSVQELLPVYDYLKDKSTGVFRSYPNDYPKNTFLESLNFNVSKLLNSGVEITNIVGNSGSDTISQIRVVPSINNLWEHGIPDQWNAGLGDNGLEKNVGDGTVPVEGSSLDINLNSMEIASNHQEIPTLAAGDIFTILTSRLATSTFSTDYGINKKILLIQLFSPVDIMVTAPDGSRVGKLVGSEGEFSEIPGAFYSGYETHEEYITILNPLEGEYKIELEGVENGGKYSVVTNYISDATSTEATFVGVAALQMISSINLQVGGSVPGDVFMDPDFEANINNMYEMGWIEDKKTRDSLLEQVKLLIRFESKFDTVLDRFPNESGKEKKVLKMVRVVDKILARLILSQLNHMLKKEKINQMAYDLLKSDFNWIINK